MAKKLVSKQEIFIDHRIAQVWGVENIDLLTSEDVLTRVLREIAEDLKLKIVNEFVHKFSPHGLSVVFVIAQSHLAVHTWPEKAYMHFDIFTCSEDTSLNILKRILKKYIKARRFSVGKLQY